MSALAATLFSLHIGLASLPMERATLSLREQALAVAAESSYVAPRVEPVQGPTALVATGEAKPRRPGVLTRQDWMNLMNEVLSNERLANAAMWIANQPVHVSMSSEKVFVSVRIATP